MAKAKKAATRKRTALTRTALIAPADNGFTPAVVKVVFKSGLGQVTASLFRLGVLINMQSISSSGSIVFSDVKRGDGISVNGICAGSAEITLSVPTQPPTPQHFNAQNINCGFDILM